MRLRAPAVMCLCLWMLAARAEEPAPDPKKEPGLPFTVAKDAKLEAVYEAKSFFEGPVWHAKEAGGGKLYFTSFGPNKSASILRLDKPGKVTAWLDPSEGVNGTWIAKDGRLIGAQAYGHRVMSYALGGDKSADAKVLYDNQKLNQPNDICQAPDGTVYFTDPDFKNKQASAVYKLEPDGQVTKIITDMPLPNGLITSLNGDRLYVADSFKKWWRRYPIKDDGTVGEGELFFDPGTVNKADPDGMSIDEKGNLYFTGRGGVWVVAPSGDALGFIPVPEFCSNVAFGGDDGKTLFFTCKNKVYRLSMNVMGGAFVPRADAKGRIEIHDE